MIDLNYDDTNVTGDRQGAAASQGKAGGMLDITYATAQTQGGRPYQEDRYVYAADMNVPGQSKRDRVSARPALKRLRISMVGYS